jgi:BAAT / Acyl-CoA thioester hydrolase C terminal
VTVSGTVELHTSFDAELWCDAPPMVSGSGFVPVTEVQLAVSCNDGSGRLWESQNGFLVSAETTFHTGLTAAFGEDYYGIAAEGPIYSMRCRDGVGHDFALPDSGELRFTFRLLDGNREIWTSDVVRHTRVERRDALGVKLFFLHNNTPGARHGHAQLEGLGYQVQERHVRPDFADLDPLLEQIRSAGKVHLVGSGRASEAALEIAQRSPELLSVSVFSGSGLRFSPWKMEGVELPYVHCDHSTLQPRGQSVLSTRKVYAEAVADRDNRNQGRIEVEKICCPLYLFSGTDDQIWPSAAFSELSSQRRKAHQREADTYHRTFPSVGYDLGPELGLPGLPTTERTLSHPSTGFRLSLGGKMGRQSRARRECWQSLLEILGGKTPQQFRDNVANTTPTDP